MKFIFSLLVASLVAIAGCSSEIDKCVDAGVRAVSLNYPSMSPAEKADVEKNYRLACMKAQAGK
jgi:hypothetical protein